MKPILITIVSTGKLKNPRWSVFSHFSDIENVELDNFKTKQEAINYAFERALYQCPIFVGSNLDKSTIIKKLTEGRS